MSTFTLAISCLTTSNLLWIMDLTFQVPVQYCSLQHRTLLLSPVTSTTRYCFCFGSIPSFFLELFLHWSPEAYWAPTDLGNSSFSILSFCHGPRRSVAERSYSSSKVGAAAERSYPMPEVRGGGWEELPHIQGAAAEQRGLSGATPRSRSGGAAMRRYPSSKVRSSSCTLLEQPWRNNPRPR